MGDELVDGWSERLGIEDPLLLADEYLAYSAEKVKRFEENQTKLSKIISELRNILRNIFPNLKFTTEDIRNLIIKSKKALEKPDPDGFDSPFDYMKKSMEYDRLHSNQSNEVRQKTYSVYSNVQNLKEKRDKAKANGDMALAEALSEKIKSMPPVSVNPEVNKNFEAAHGTQKESTIEKLKALAEKAKETVHHFKYIRESEFPNIYNKLRLFESIPEITKKQAFERILSFIKPIARNKNLYEAFERIIVLQDLLYDVQNTDHFSKSKELPWGYNSVEEIQRDVDNLQDYAMKNPVLKQALDKRYAYMQEVREQLIANKLLGEKSRDNKYYFHHQVMAFMKKRVGDNPKDVRNNTKGWQRSRHGSLKAYNTNYVESEFQVLAESLQQIAIKKTLNDIRDEVDIMPDLIKQAIEEGGKWRDYIPDGYIRWYPKKGTNPYRAATQVEKMIQGLVDTDENADLVDQMLAESDQKLWVIPTIVAKQLDEMKDPVRESPLAQGSRFISNSWKQWVLINPYRLFKYNLNNLSGDLDIVIAYDPKILKYAPAAIKEAWQNLINKGMSQDFEEALEQGVITSGLTLQEIPDISNEIGIYKSIAGKINPFSVGWKSAKNFTQFRENVLRLAAYKYFKKELSKDKKVYGASERKAIDAITNKNEKAGKLARELVGDYGNLSQGGQWLRSHTYPFWSWVEINAPRYYRLLKNTRWENGNTTSKTVGRAGAITASNALKLSAKMMILMGLVSLWNSLFFDDEDKELTEMGNRQLMLIVGRRDDGSIITVRINGAFSDMLSWAGLEDAPRDIKELKEGTSTVGDKVKEAGEAFINKFAQGVMPIEKTAIESIIGYSTYPNILKPRPIRDKGENVARFVSMDKVWRLMTKKPTRGWDELVHLAAYSNDPGEIAYYTMRQKITEFLDDNEVNRPSITPSDRSNVLFYYKQAIKWGDKKAEEHWLQKYYNMGGTDQGLKSSITKGELISIVPKDLREKWEKSLTPDEKELYDIANKWYDNMYKK
jgi:hypothetical protein